MFNDVLITGHFEIQLDDKNRMFIPAKTGVEGKELVVLKKDICSNRECLRLIAYQSIKEKIAKIEAKMINASTIKQYNMYQALIDSFCIELEELLSVDAMHRITLPRDITESMGISRPDTLYGTGTGTSLVLTKYPIKNRITK